MNLEWALVPSATVWLMSDALNATTVSTEKFSSAQLTDIVPMADDLRPEKGKTSGERPH
eukprot:CAMPEP_0197845118 /NCGR_PEP_ID=MMETSP1438-20131217/2069_1 /TAXON_ID=1461541 /ORGANISM="Pterosperma sp., Strain CCMP1384" /LENGTH=58 /DNA_ID=CAMNT_0043456241 /DNA_START=273 /DNA_END=449 /DNA_ORIENTATION=-